MNTFKILVMAALVGIFSKTLFAQEPQEQRSQEFLDKAVKAYEHSLDFKVSAVVESAIYNVMVMKQYYPREDYDDIMDIVNDLVADGKTASVRYKAQLASLYFEYPELFKNIEFEKSTENADKYFKEISDKLVSYPLALN